MGKIQTRFGSFSAKKHGRIASIKLVQCPSWIASDQGAPNWPRGVYDSWPKERPHVFPGTDGGTCINEAAIIAAGFAHAQTHQIARISSST